MDNLKICNFYIYNYNGFNMKPHSHAAIEIMYNLGASCTINIFTDKRESIAFKKNQIILINAQIAHSLFIKENVSCKILNLEFLPSADQGINFKDILGENKNIYSDFSFVLVDDYFNGYEQMQTLHKLLTGNLKSSKLITDSNLLTLLLNIFEYKNLLGSSLNLHVLAAKKFIADNYMSNLSIDSIAKHVGISPVYLQKQFKSVVSSTIFEYITIKRIDRAKHLLQNTRMSVTDIAFECGFNSRQSLFQNFQKTCGCSIRDYKAKLQNEKLNKNNRAHFEEYN